MAKWCMATPCEGSPDLSARRAAYLRGDFGPVSGSEPAYFTVVSKVGEGFRAVVKFVQPSMGAALRFSIRAVALCPRRIGIRV